VFWVTSVYFNIRNTLPKFGTFLLGHPVNKVQLRVSNNKISRGQSTQRAKIIHVSEQVSNKNT